MLETVVLSQLMYNDEYQRKVLPYLKSDFFDNEGEKVVFGIIDSFISEYNATPNLDALAIMLDKSKLNENVFAEAIDCVSCLESTPQNLEWLIKETEAWAKAKSVQNVIKKAVVMYSDDKKKEELSLIPKMMEEALAVSFDNYLGHVYWEMAGEQYDHMHQDSTKIPFGVDIFNRATRGGVLKKTLNIVTGAINAGKTTTLIHLAADYAEQGLNAYVATLEVADNQWRHRLDARIMRIDFDKLEAMTREEYLGTIQKLHKNSKGDTKGDIIIKEYPSGAGHTGFFRNDIIEYERKTGKKIDVILIDYLTESASSRLPVHLMSNTNIYYTSVAREFRALGFEFDCPVWTGMQFTREKQNSSDGDMGDIADAIGIPKVADFIMSFYAPDELANVKKARANILKNRYANKQKLKSFLFGMDQDKQILFDLDWSEVKQDLSPGEASYIEKVQLRHDKNKTGIKAQDDAKAETVNNWKF